MRRLVQSTMRQVACVVALAAALAACGSTQPESARSTTPSSTPATARKLTHAQRETQDTQLLALVRSLRSKLGDDFVGTSGTSDRAGALTGLDVILVDGSSSRSRLGELRRLFATTVPSASPSALHFVFSPVSEKTLLAAYEEFNGELANGGLRLPTFDSLGVDRPTGSLAVALDGTNPDRAARDSAAIRSWAKGLAPVSVRVTINRHGAKRRP